MAPASAGSAALTASREVARLPVADLAAMLGQPDLVLLDVRGLDFFLGYIPGSRRAPFELRDRELERLAAELGETRKKVVFVCKTGESFSKHYAHDFLQSTSTAASGGQCEVYVLEGGFRAWEQCFVGQDRGRFVAKAACFPGAPHAPLSDWRRSAFTSPELPTFRRARLRPAGPEQERRRHSDTRPPPMVAAEGSVCSEDSTATTCTSLATPSPGEASSPSTGPAPLRNNASAPALKPKARWPSRSDSEESEDEEGAVPCMPMAATQSAPNAELRAKVCRWLTSDTEPAWDAPTEQASWRMRAKTGDVLWIRLAAERWRQCLVVATDEATVKVRYFTGGKGHVLHLPRTSDDLQLGPIEESVPIPCRDASARP